MSGSAGWARSRACCRWSARSFPTRRITDGSRAASASGIRTAPTETEGWRFFLVDADAPAEVKDVLRRYYMRYSGPAGMTEQDDMENWLYATKASTGTIARRYPFNYQMSMGAYKTDDPIPGDVSLQITDQTPRNFYRVYANYLNGGDWDVLLGRDGVPMRAAAE